MRFLILVLLVVLAVWMIRRALGHGGQRDAMKRQDEMKRQTPVEGDLVACARCGVLLPRTEARTVDGVLFCSDEHARLGRS